MVRLFRNRPYLLYLTRKAFWYLVAFVAAVALNFFLPRLIPGNPVSVIVGQMSAGAVESATLERLYATFMRDFGLDRPLPVQFWTYLTGVLQGDLGTSFMLYPAKVWDVIRQALPWTVALQVPAILVGWILGNVLGALAAYKGGAFDRVAFTGSLMLSSIPYFCLAIIFMYLFAVHWPLFPASGGYSSGYFPEWSWGFFLDALHHYALPFLTLVLVAIGGQAIGMREMAIYELNTDYVNYARKLGVRDRRVVRYVFRNAMLPQITGLAISFGTLIGGALVTEAVFSYPGLGSLLFTAIRQVDYPMIQGITLIITLTVLLANFLVDIAYGFIDPRIRAGQAGGR